MEVRIEKMLSAKTTSRNWQNKPSGLKKNYKTK